jgi:hypothetical protein
MLSREQTLWYRRVRCFQRRPGDRLISARKLALGTQCQEEAEGESRAAQLCCYSWKMKASWLLALISSIKYKAESQEV